MASFTTTSPSKQYLVDFSKDNMTKPIFNGVVQPTHSLSETSFFIDSDVEDTGSEAGDSFDDEGSPVDSSVESLSEQSQATASPLDLTTPTSLTGENSPNPIFRLKSIKGREEKDCHLFRATLASTQDLNWETYDPEPPAEDVPDVPEIPAQFKSEADELQGSAINQTDGVEGSENDVRNWTTQQVAAWMYNSGFENSIISTFKTHDINGSILLELSFEDLRELDIVSFGKRRQIWHEVNALRNEGSPDPLKAAAVRDDRGCSYLAGLNNPTERSRRPGFDKNGTITGYRRPMRTPGEQPTQRQQPVSEIPRPHRCSKGEKCPRWKQQQRIIAEVDREHGPSTPPSGKFDIASPRSPRLPQVLPAMTETTSTPHPLETPPPSDASTPTAPQQADDSIPPVPPLPAQVFASFSTTKNNPPPSLDTKHIVQQYQKGNPSSALTPETPQWDLFPNPGSGGQSYPPRQSSLGTLPKLTIPLSPAHSPSSSDSTIRYGEKDPAVSPNNPSPAQPKNRAASPELVPRPLSPPLSARTRSPSPNLVAIAKQSSPDSFSSSIHQLRSPASESDIPITPAPLFKRDLRGSTTSTTQTKPPVLRSAISSDAIHRRRNLNLLPTLREGGLTANQSTESLAKPLPNLPMTSVFPPTRKVSAPATTDAGSAPTLTLYPSPLHPVRSISPNKSLASTVSNKASPASRSAASPTPQSANPITPATASLPSSVSSSTNPSPEPQSYGPEIVRTGWVRQRRARLWRHEWVPMHVRLTGTQMTLHPSARTDEKPIDMIKMDEYEVAVGSSNSGNKITNAFRGFRPGGGSKGSNSSVSSLDESLFEFRLIPRAEMLEMYSPNVRGSTGSARAGLQDDEATLKAAVDGKYANGKDENIKMLKSFQFAVKTGDERIEWMRQLMMVKGQLTKDNMKKAEKENDAEGVRPATRSGSF